jgi:hypothetical protein
MEQDSSSNDNFNQNEEKSFNSDDDVHILDLPDLFLISVFKKFDFKTRIRLSK